MPKGEIGLDVMTLIGTLRFVQYCSVPEIHQDLLVRWVVIAGRSVTNLLYRYEELVALSLTNQARQRDRLAEQAQVTLAIDGLQPDVGHEVLWVIRDCLSGEVLRARSLLSGREADLAPLLREVAKALPVPTGGSSPTVNSRSARRWRVPCPACRTRCASSIISRQPPCPSTRPTDTPRRN